jgi:hypothetical protein
MTIKVGGVYSYHSVLKFMARRLTITEVHHTFHSCKYQTVRCKDEHMCDGELPAIYIVISSVPASNWLHYHRLFHLLISFHSI